MIDVDEREAANAALDAAEEQLQSLCASHAGTFVEVERRGRALKLALEELLKTIPSAESMVLSTQNALEQEQEDGPGRERENSLAALSEKHRVRRRTLLQHSTLLELLELPSLMDACVRSNLYEEALNIAAFANTLERRHIERNAVVVKVIEQVRSRQSDLRRYLLHSLKNNVTMPECLEIITALRRLNSIDLERLRSADKSSIERTFTAMELSLQVDFLEARDTWLDQLSSSTKSTEMDSGKTISCIGTKSNVLIQPQSEQLLDTIERYRTRMFEIATQYNAIFRAQQTTYSRNGASSRDGNVSNINDKNKVSVPLLSMWTSRRIQTFLKILSSQLQTMDDSGSLRDALDACVFFTSSMGRLGADFTAQLPPIFEKQLMGIVLRHWNEGVNQLAETLKICRDAGVASPLISSAVVTAPTDDENTKGEENESAPCSGTMMAPPRQLMALPPLGRLVNACLIGLNELRRCLMPGVIPHLREAVEKDFLLETKNILHSHERAVLSPGIRGDATKFRQNAKDMKKMTKSVIFPYLRGAVELSTGNEKDAKKHFDKVKEFLQPLPRPQPAPSQKPLEEINSNESTAKDKEKGNSSDTKAERTVAVRL